jgi:hypothetical protein
MIFSPLIMKDIYGNINKRKFGILDITKKKREKVQKNLLSNPMWEDVGTKIWTSSIAT